jgi:hypothetical protein
MTISLKKIQILYRVFYAILTFLYVTKVRTNSLLKRGFFYFYVRYTTLLHVPPLRFHCVGGCWDRTQDCCECDFGIDSQTL